jgi:imidazolonepropionase-like amidohydrolase
LPLLLRVNHEFNNPIGLVDMHSHVGVSSWPGLEASEDVNEETIPTAPFLRSLDSFDPNDPAIRMISAVLLSIQNFTC